MLSGQTWLGLALALISSLAMGGMGAIMIVEEDYDLLAGIGMGLICGIIVYVALWLICALLGLLFNWTFGFGPEWQVSLFYGLALCMVSGAGLVSIFSSIQEA